jgi:hypothetical protein
MPVVALVVRSCLGAAREDEPPPDVPPAVAAPDERLHLHLDEGHVVVTVDVDRFLGWPGPPLGGRRNLEIDASAVSLLARAGAARSVDGVARIDADDLGWRGVCPLADLLQGAGYRSVVAEEREPLTVAEDGRLLCDLGYQEGFDTLDPRPRTPTVVAWGQADPARLAIHTSTELTVVHVDGVLSRLHPALAVGPARVGHGPMADVDLQAALEPIWAAADLTGRTPGPIVVDVGRDAGAPRDSATYAVLYVTEHLRRRGIGVRVEDAPAP